MAHLEAHDHGAKGGSLSLIKSPIVDEKTASEDSSLHQQPSQADPRTFRHNIDHEDIEFEKVRDLKLRSIVMICKADSQQIASRGN